MRILGAMAALMLAAPALAGAMGTDSFYHAKTGYNVDVRHEGDTMLLDGYNYASHARFHLVVTGGQVTGTFAGEPVNYVMGHAAPRADLLASAAQ